MAELERPEVMAKMIRLVSSLLERVAESNDVVFPLSDAQKMSIFHGLSRPTISIRSYMERIFKYANCSSSCFVVAYVYLDRFVHKHPMLPLNSFNVHRLLIASVLVSAKFMDDMWVSLILNSFHHFFSFKLQRKYMCEFMIIITSDISFFLLRWCCFNLVIVCVCVRFSCWWWHYWK